MNETLKGFRTIVLTVLSLVLGNIDVINGMVQDIAGIVGQQLSEGGAVATLVGSAVMIKQIITDAIPKMKGTLDK